MVVGRQLGSIPLLVREVIHPTAVIGDPPESREFFGRGVPPMISPQARIEAFVTVDAGTKHATFVGDRTWLMKHVHVGHDAWIDSDCELAPHCSVGGHVTIERRVRVGQGAIFKPFVTVGVGARIGMGAVVIRDVPAGEVWAGNPARCIHAASEQMHNDSEVAGWEQVARA
jgi:acyl-[acyl carrier protein]--UDP-N-acetylglucosamine O-acyltransferase